VDSAELPLGRLLVSAVACLQPFAVTSVDITPFMFPLEADTGLS
jgi:hypothetical protein